MSNKTYLYTILIGVLLFILNIGSVFAGFGITPPYVKNASLTRNSQYQQEIFLVRSDPVNDLRVEIAIDVPGINDWFTIDKGTEFIMPRGEVKTPIKVNVKVPGDVDFGNYRGAIRIRTSPADNSRTGSGAVSIALGAQIDVDLTIIDKKIYDFRVRRISISDVNAGHPVAWLYFPGKIRFAMNIENTGNIDVAPSKVTFDIYDITGKNLIEQTESTNRIQTVAPFETNEVIAEIPTRLSPGNYIARYKIYNGEDVKQDGELNLSIVPYGTSAAAGYGFLGLSLRDKASIIAPIILVLLALWYIFRPRKRKRRTA